jgi:hypothetical protein
MKRSAKPKLSLRERLTMSAQTKRLWRNRLIFVLVVALGIAAYVIYIHSYTFYDYGHLIEIADNGESRVFAPLGGAARVEGMVRVAQTDYLALYINEEDTSIAVLDLRNNFIWHSTPEGVDNDPRANPFERGTMRSLAGFEFFNQRRATRTNWLFPDAVEYEQFEIFSIDNGVRIKYEIGDKSLGIYELPFFIEEEFFAERVFSHAESILDQMFLNRFWFIDENHSDYKEGFIQLSPSILQSRIEQERMLEFFESIGWTDSETERQNALSGWEPDVDFDYFNMVIELILQDDRLIFNLPLSEFTTDSGSLPSTLSVMPFFGAGGAEAEGFMLVPSGSGGIIMFDDGTTGRHLENQFRSVVYGRDPVTHIIRPQVEQSVRLPVFGIQNDGAAILAHVTSGSALARVNAEIAGRTNSYNQAWFSFMLRESTALAMHGSEMTIIQEEKYSGDITVMYHFLAGDNPGIGEMAQAYQGFLFSDADRLSNDGDRSFYMDVIGAIDVWRHFVGTPYLTTEVMTTLADASRFVDELNKDGINTVQMQLHGWFNRGINHDVAKNVRRLGDVGSRQEMLDLNARLQASNGGLYPAVNFQFVSYDSRKFNETFESAKDIAGFVGYSTRYTMRDSLTTRFTHHRNDWRIVVHPGVLPFHVDDFLPAYQRRTAMDSIALTDLGDIVTESLFRRDAIDRESARLIVEEQLSRINNQVPNIMVSGGNNFALQYASHIVDVPTRTDLQYIIDYEVPFFPMVVHGYIEFAGRPTNIRDMGRFCEENGVFINVMLESMTTGASPRYIFTAEPTRNAQFSPHERFYSTQYENWLVAASNHYKIFNDVYADLRGERIVNFEVLAGNYLYEGGEQVTVTEFSNGTRIYVNNTTRPFNANGVTVPPEWFVVRGGTR